MSTTMDKIMQAMAAAAAASEIGPSASNEAGARLLALIRHGGTPGFAPGAFTSGFTGFAPQTTTAANENQSSSSSSSPLSSPSSSPIDAGSPTSCSPSSGGGGGGVGGGGGLASVLGLHAGGGESKIRYDRDFLFHCAESPLCREMPRGLAPKLEEFPQMKRKIRSSSGGPMNNHHHSNNPDHFRFFEHQPSIVDSLPLRPTAQIFTWDPTMGQWVPRARPQEV